jgi:hypothetical protein
MFMPCSLPWSAGSCLIWVPGSLVGFHWRSSSIGFSHRTALSRQSPIVERGLDREPEPKPNVRNATQALPLPDAARPFQ